MHVREASAGELAELFAELDLSKVEVAVCAEGTDAAIAAATDGFDSEMLRMRIARVVRAHASSTTILTRLYLELGDRLRRAGYDQAVRRVSAGDWREIWALQRSGFEVMDVGVTFARRLDRPVVAPQYDELVVRPAVAEDLQQSTSEMLREPWGSRYEADPAYRAEDIRRLREQWLRNSLAGRADVFLVGLLGSKVAGYATGRLDFVRGLGPDSRQGDIELLGTLPAFRRRRVAARVLEHMVAWFSARADLLRVRTQATNYAAANLYQKSGFLLSESDMTFRLALTDEGGADS